MPDYNKGCIYLIKHNQDFNDENVYIGSCCNFTRRKCDHKKVCNNPNDKRHNLKIYQTIRENGGWDNWVMIKLHNFPCNEKHELNLEERRVIDLYQSKLNMRLPTRTTKEWCEDNKKELNEKKKKYREEHKEELNEKSKKYYENNKEQINEKKKKWYEEHKEKISEKYKKYYENNKEKLAEKSKIYREEHREEKNEYAKIYRENNKEEINEKQKKYYENNKEKIKENVKIYYENNKEQKNEKITCECGSITSRQNISNHRKTKKHISFLNNMK